MVESPPPPPFQNFKFIYKRGRGNQEGQIKGYYNKDFFFKEIKYLILLSLFHMFQIFSPEFSIVIDLNKNCVYHVIINKLKTNQVKKHFFNKEIGTHIFAS